MKLVLISLMAIALIACNKKDDGKKGDGKGSGTVDVTDRSACRGATPAGMNITSKAWRIDQKHDDGSSDTQVFVVTGDSVTVYVSCFKKNTQVNAAARATANVTASTLEITSDGARIENGTTADGETFGCEAKLEISSPMPYSFEGPCLRLQNQGETRTLAPHN